MSGRKYPLDPLIKLRERQVDDATSDLAKAVGARQAAERKREAAELAKDRADEAADATRTDERGALERGELTAADLLRAQAWELGVAEERKRLAQQVAVATQGEDEAREEEDGARATLAAREADAEVVEKDKERFVTREKQREIAKEEEAASDAHASRQSKER
jgi:hypothetical protein